MIQVSLYVDSEYLSGLEATDAGAAALDIAQARSVVRGLRFELNDEVWSSDLYTPVLAAMLPSLRRLSADGMGHE